MKAQVGMGLRVGYKTRTLSSSSFEEKDSGVNCSYHYEEPEKIITFWEAKEKYIEQEFLSIFLVFPPPLLFPGKNRRITRKSEKTQTITAIRKRGDKMGSHSSV